LYLIAIIAPVTSAVAVGFPSVPNMPLSQYGQIQNVQNYSSNPFWSPNGPYDQRFPTPVYAQGTDLNASQCQAVVAQLVAAQCGMANNCAGAKLNDVKAAVMVQLSRMTGNNYVSACSGFIDGAFNDYVKQYGSAVQPTGFPAAIAPGNNQPQPEFKIKNPYAPQLPSYSGEEWFKDIIDRSVELKQLQAQNGAGNERLVATQMPATYADLSFTERMENAREGYEPWADKSAYKTIQIEKDEDRRIREAAEATHRAEMLKAQADAQKLTDKMNMSHNAFCDKYPAEADCHGAGNGDGNGKEHVKVILKSLIKK
jgi:hypothetical protein